MDENRNGILSSTLYGNYITAVIRIVMGLLLVYSGFFKTLDLEAFGRTVAMYDIAPEWMVPYAAMIFPVLELILGLCLVMGVRIQSASLIATGLMVVFSLAIAVNVARGRTFECGCFELNRLGMGIEERVSALLVVRDLVLAGFYVIIFRVRNNLLSLEHVVERLRLRYL